MSRTTNSKQTRNLAARMGRWSANHWKTATFGWLLLVVVAFGIGGMVGTKNPNPNTSGPGESGRMDRILDAGFKPRAAESLFVQSATVRAGTPAFDAVVQDAAARISRVPVVTHIESPKISKNGYAVLVDFEISGPKDKAPDKVEPVVDAVAAAQAAHPGFFIGEMGDASAQKAVMDQYGKDLGKAGMLSLPITLIILLVTFGALVAAGIPLLLALTAVFATFGLVAIPSHVLPMPNEVPALVLLIGLAVGVDYTMFYLRREREERAKGRSERAALEAAAATSGRSVLISGLTVMVAMAGMLVTGDKTFAAFGIATMMVVAVAMLGSLTVLPALLSRLGDGVDRGRFRRRRPSTGEGRLWGWIVDRVLRRPALSAAIAGGLLLLLALPAVQMRMAEASPDTYPAHLEVIKTYKRMQVTFPGTALPANVIVKAPNVNAPAVRVAISQLEQRALASGRAHEPITIDVNPAGTVANITIPIDGNGTNKASNESLKLLRKTLIPQTVGAGAERRGRRHRADRAVEGLRATRSASALPLVVAFVLVFAFALMLVAFRSIVVAAKAIVLNCLSVAAAYGILVLVFQHGFGKGLLGFELDRRHLAGDPAAPVRDPVRALDGLPRVHRQPDPRAVPAWSDHGRGDLGRHPLDGGRRDQRGDRDGLRVRGLRDAVDAVLQAVRRRARGGDPDRRDDRPRRAAAGVDEAARRAELVPPVRGSSGCRTSTTASSRSWTSPRPSRHRRSSPEDEADASESAEITGLLLIAILAIGLAYLRFSSDGGSRSPSPPGRRPAS